MTPQQEVAGPVSLETASSGSSSALEYIEAISKALEKDPPAEPLVPFTRHRPSVELPRDRATEQELISFKLFDGQSLQYTDRITDGCYDIWGFVGIEDNTPVAKFPSLDKLASIPFIEGDTREVVVVDRRNDTRLQELHQTAADVVAEYKSRGAMVCAQAIAQLVAEAMGGASSHIELAQRYKVKAQQLKRERGQLVLPIGELTVGLSRQRALLLKTLADSCGLPCRILRSDFYLGAAGHSGDYAVAMLQFNNREWMVELVTEPGRLYCIRSGTIPKPGTACLWESRKLGEHESHQSNAPQESSARFPTVPDASGEEVPERTSSSGTASSGQKDGLQWSELDGLTMDELVPSEHTESPPKSSSESLRSVPHMELSAGFSARGVEPEEQLHGQDPGSRGTKSAEEERNEAAADGIRRQASMPHDTDRIQDSTDSAGGPWLPWKDASKVRFTPPANLVPNEVVQGVLDGKYGSVPSIGPARARVRGTDAKGRAVELELEGLTVTHAHNLEVESRSLELQRPPVRSSEDVGRNSRSLESMISRYRVLEPHTAQRNRRAGTTAHLPFAGSKQASNGEPPWQVGSLALQPLPETQATEQRGSLEELHRKLRENLPALSEPVQTEGQEWEQQMREAYLSDHQARSSEESARRLTQLGEQLVAPEQANNRLIGLLSTSKQQHPTPSTPSQEEKQASQQDPNSRASSAGAEGVYGKKSGSGQAGGSSKEGSVIGAGSGSRDGSGNSTAADRFSMASEANLAELRARADFRGRNPRVKEHRSSNSTFYDMMGMASSAKESDVRRQQMPEQRPEDRQPSGGQGTNAASITTSHKQHIPGPGHGHASPELDEAEVLFSEIELGPRIGVGCFGEVFKARWRQTTVAVKRLFDQSLAESTLREFKAEVQLNRRMKHPNICMFMGACTQPPNLSIITQWAPRGSLFQLLHNPKPGRPPLTLRQKLRMALDIARGMHYLHSARPPVIHRDLKSMNLLVDNDLTIKVCDFGLARIRSSTWMTGRSQGGTPEWTAPEVLRNSQYNEKSDVYSYGVVLYELAAEREPWDEMTPMQVVGAVGWAGNRLDPPPDCPPVFGDLMLRCFEGPNERPSFEEIIQLLLRHANETRPDGQGSGPHSDD